jgi:hypothetical protein
MSTSFLEPMHARIRRGKQMVPLDSFFYVEMNFSPLPNPGGKS